MQILSLKILFKPTTNIVSYFGREIVKTVPFLFFDLYDILPLCEFIILLTIPSPNPIPSDLVVNFGSNIFSLLLLETPSPLSETVTLIFFEDSY